MGRPLTARGRARRARRGAAPAGAAPASGAWRVIAAAAAGSGHRRVGEPCADAYAWRVCPGALLAAIADGAGSAPLGGRGATIAARAAVEAASGALGGRMPAERAAWRTLIAGALEVARAALLAEAVGCGLAVTELATTLVLLAAADGVVAVGQVGDGAAVARDHAGVLHALTTPRHGEYVNETTFLSAPDALEGAQLTVWSGRATHLALLSDGLQMLALTMPEGTPHAPFFAPVFRFASDVADDTDAAAQLLAFLAGPRVQARTDDDVSLLLAVQAGRGASLAGSA